MTSLLASTVIGLSKETILQDEMQVFFLDKHPKNLVTEGSD